MNKIGDHAVVLGASMAGLLAGRALADAYHRVTVLDRDPLPAAAEPRRGVPQGRQAHLLLPSGARVLDEFFPGFLDDLAAAGVPVLREYAEMHFSVGGHLLSKHGMPDRPAYQATRPYLESQVRARVRVMPGVELRGGTDVAGLVAEGSRVVGVQVLAREPGSSAETIPADVVVDATGRGGRTRAWLAELGYGEPRVEELPVNLRYVTQDLKLVPGAIGELKLVAIGAVPGRPTGMVLVAQEDRWRLMLFGYGGHHPPTDPAGYLEFVREVAPPEVFAAIAAAEPLSTPRSHRFPANLRRKYERMRRFPDGLLVIGDALCSFNPLYAQGMSVAALEAAELRRCLARGEQDLARRYFRAAARCIDIAWQMAVGGDLALPEVAGKRSLAVRVANAWVDLVQAAAETDPTVAGRFVRVAGLQDPPSRLLAPDVVARVVRQRLRGGRRSAKKTVLEPHNPVR